MKLKDRRRMSGNIFIMACWIIIAAIWIFVGIVTPSLDGFQKWCSIITIVAATIIITVNNILLQ